MASRTQALIIGNGAYEGDLRLDSPPKDANSVAACFGDLGIEYDLVLDATFEQATEAVKSFLERVARPTTEVSILYYSGHGMQLKETRNATACEPPCGTWHHPGSRDPPAADACPSDCAEACQNGC
ncbi:caspase family protein [Rhizobium ruizarguesonis]|nr:caspase family protein [Rhizobium ruizarguesonis]TBA31366.1 caspase family protein [Rhizobium ruizarguesonis]